MSPSRSHAPTGKVPDSYPMHFFIDCLILGQSIWNICARWPGQVDAAAAAVTAVAAAGAAAAKASAARPRHLPRWGCSVLPAKHAWWLWHWVAAQPQWPCMFPYRYVS